MGFMGGRSDHIWQSYSHYVTRANSKQPTFLLIVLALVFFFFFWWQSLKSTVRHTWVPTHCLGNRQTKTHHFAVVSESQVRLIVALSRFSTMHHGNWRLDFVYLNRIFSQSPVQSIHENFTTNCKVKLCCVV